MSEYERQNPGLAYEPAGQDFGIKAESRSEKSPEDIEREIEETRTLMSQNIDELGDRLSPDNLKHEAKSAIRHVAHDAVSNVGEQARRTGSRLVDVIRENPLPVIAVGAGVTWLRTQHRAAASGQRMARYPTTGPIAARATAGSMARIKGRAVRPSGCEKDVSEAASGIKGGSRPTGPRRHENRSSWRSGYSCRPGARLLCRALSARTSSWAGSDQ